MKFEAIRRIVDGVPFISVENARYLYDLILREGLTNILELGIGHGTATCYMAAALDELGRGKITSVDLIAAKDSFQPTAEDQLQKAGLEHFARVVRTQTGYTWFLHDEIKRVTVKDQCRQEYDLCIIDGPKNWTVDGCAFFLVDKILKENGWLIFDDYQWTYAEADTKREATDGISHRALSEAERCTPQVREVYELLVKQHPDYGEFYLPVGSDWAIARKRPLKQKEYTIQYKTTYADFLANWIAVARDRVKSFNIDGKIRRD